jgi:RIO kinase 1
MELIADEDGHAAPRLSDVALTPEQALEDHSLMMQYVVRMLCAGLVHGDLSEFNVLVDEYGPVIIDLPQAVDAAANNHASTMLERDVNNMTNYYGQFHPELIGKQFAGEIWELYESGELHPDTILSGLYQASTELADVDAVMQDIKDVLAEEAKRQERLLENEEVGD